MRPEDRADLSASMAKAERNAPFTQRDLEWESSKLASASILSPQAERAATIGRDVIAAARAVTNTKPDAPAQDLHASLWDLANNRALLAGELRALIARVKEAQAVTGHSITTDHAERALAAFDAETTI